MLTPEQAKNICINGIEQYLQINKIKYDKAESASGSTYFTLELWNGSPKIRVSDHNFHKDEDYKLCSLSIVYTQDIGKNANPKKVKVRVQKMVDKLVKSHNVYSIHKTLEKLNKKDDSTK